MNEGMILFLFCFVTPQMIFPIMTIIICLGVIFGAIFYEPVYKKIINTFKPKVEFPYLEFIGLSETEAKKKYNCADVKFSMGLFKQINNKGIIVGWNFYVNNYFDYEKYYSSLEAYARASKVKIVEQTDGRSFEYLVTDFDPPIEECGLYKKNEADRKNLEIRCDKLLERELKRILDEEKFNNFKKRIK